MKFYKKILLVIIILNCNLLYSQNDNGFEYQKNTNKFINVFNQHKAKYISIIKDSLRHEFRALDSVYFEQFEYIIIPTFYLNSSAENFTQEDNLFDFLELDTINYECSAYLIKDSILRFYANLRGCCGDAIIDRSILPPVFGYLCINIPIESEIDKILVKHYYEPLIKYQWDLIFQIKGLYGNILINGETLNYYALSSEDLETGDPNEWLIKRETIEGIRTTAENCKPIDRNSFFDNVWYRYKNIFR